MFAIKTGEEKMDVAPPLWAYAFDGYLLMKFTSQYDYQQDFLDGRLYFNTADRFATCKDKGRHDSNEGNTFVANYNNNPELKVIDYEFIGGKIAFICRDYSSNPEEYRPGTVLDFSAAENRKRKIISFFTLLLDIEHQKVSEIPANIKDEFGEFGILILNQQEFFRRVSDAFLKHPECQKVYMGFVNYEPMQPGINQWHPFRKDAANFSYQKEFRMTFVNDTEDPFILDLEASLRDIAVPIMADVVGNIHIKDGTLLYPFDSK